MGDTQAAGLISRLWSSRSTPSRLSVVLPVVDRQAELLIIGFAYALNEQLAGLISYVEVGI